MKLAHPKEDKMQIENLKTDPITPLETVRKRRHLLPALLALGCIGLSSFAIARNLQSNFATPQRSQQFKPFDAPAPYQVAAQVPYQVVAQTDPRTPTYNPYNPQPTIANPIPHANQSIATTLTAPIAPMNQNYVNQNYAQAPAGYARAVVPNSFPPNVTYASPANVGPAYTNPAERAAAEEIQQLVIKLRQASGERKSELRKSLNEAVSKQFELRHSAQAKQVEKLEAELAEAKELHKKRGERKAEIIERRLAELLESADDLAWNRELVARATSNYSSNYSLPNSNAQPYFHESVPSSGPNQPYPYGPPARFYPNSTPLNSLPQSSTPPQFIPLNAPDAGQPGLLKTTPESINPPVGALSPLPTPFGEAASNSDLTTTSKSMSTPTLNSKAVIESAYTYDEALDAVIETQKLAAKGVLSLHELSSAKRKAAKAKAIWNGVGREIAMWQQILESELIGKKDLIKGDSTQEKRAELALELSKLEFERQSLAETQAWIEGFIKESIDPLEKQLEQGAEQKSEQKSESKLESLPNAN